MRAILLSLLALAAAPALADPHGADVVFLGETHDNPAHHQAQAAAVRDYGPFAALVFEMLDEDQAAAANAWLAAGGDAAGMGAAAGWSDAWPDYALYAPIVAAAPNPRIYGAWLRREALMGAARNGPATLFDSETAARLRLTGLPPPAEQAARDAAQVAAHCDMIPLAVAPRLVAAQRARDAALALAAATALAQTGRVAVITGSGHARKDWGAPLYLSRLAPTTQIWSIGLLEPAGSRAWPEGAFDAIQVFAAPSDRGDPCAAFRSP